MSYLIGELSQDDEEELAARGWHIEPAPSDMIPSHAYLTGSDHRWRMVYMTAKASVFDIVSAFEHEESHRTEHEETRLP